MNLALDLYLINLFIIKIFLFYIFSSTETCSISVHDSLHAGQPQDDCDKRNVSWNCKCRCKPIRTSNQKAVPIGKPKSPSKNLTNVLFFVLFFLAHSLTTWFRSPIITQHRLEDSKPTQFRHDRFPGLWILPKIGSSQQHHQAESRRWIMRRIFLSPRSFRNSWGPFIYSRDWRWEFICTGCWRERRLLASLCFRFIPRQSAKCMADNSTEEKTSGNITKRLLVFAYQGAGVDRATKFRLSSRTRLRKLMIGWFVERLFGLLPFG